METGNNTLTVNIQQSSPNRTAEEHFWSNLGTNAAEHFPALVSSYQKEVGVYPSFYLS